MTNPASTHDLLEAISADNHALLYRCRYDAETLEELLPQLKSIVADPDPETRRAVLSALSRIGPAARTALGWVVPLIEDEDWIVRTTAVSAIGRLCLGDGAAAVVPLRRAANDPSLLTQVLHACTSLRESVRPLSDVFVDAYRQGDAQTRRLAVRCLLLSKARDTDSLATLEAARADKHARVRKAASRGP